MYCWLLTTLILTNYVHCISLLKDMPRFFQQQNDVSISNIVIFSDGRMECQVNNRICEEIASELLSDIKELPITFLNIDKNNLERFGKVLKDSFLSLIIFLNFDESVILKNYLQNVSSYDLSHNAWLIIENQEDFNRSDVDIQDHQITNFRSLNSLRIDSQLYLLSYYNDSYSLFEIYKICSLDSLVIKEVFDSESSFEMNSDSAFIWKRRRNLDGCPLYVAYANIKEWFEVLPIVNTTKHQSTMSSESLVIGDKLAIGFPTKLLEMVWTNFNFSIKWVHAEDDSIGVKDKNTSDWTGLIGVLNENRADFGAFPVSVRQARKSVVTFSNSFETYEYRLFMKKPGPSASWFTFVEVFHPEYWMALMISFILFSVFIALFLVIYKTFNQKSNGCNVLSKNLSIFWVGISANLLSLGALDINMAKDISHNSPVSLRMIFFIVCAFGMLNHYVYDAGLTSHLMVQSFDIPIKNLGDILDKTNYKLLVWRGAADESFFSEANNPTVQDVWKKTLKQNNPIKSYNEGEKLIINDPNMVLFAESPYFPTTFDSYPCKVISASTPYGRHSGAYAFSMGSPYTKLFGYYITQLQESGLLPIKENKGNSQCPDEGGYSSLGYDKLYSAFVFGSAGILLAFAYCGIELIYKACKAMKKNDISVDKNQFLLRRDNLKSMYCQLQYDMQEMVKFCNEDVYFKFEEYQELQEIAKSIVKQNKVIKLLMKTKNKYSREM